METDAAVDDNATSACEIQSPRRINRRVWWRAIGIFLSCGSLYLLYRMASKSGAIVAITQLPPLPLMATILLGYVAFPMRVEQWRLLVSGEARRASLYYATLLGHAASVLLPFRGGEVVKGVYLMRQSALPLSRIALSIFAARIQDLPPILLIVALLMFLGVPENGATAFPALIPGLSIDIQSRDLEWAFVALTSLAALLAVILLGIGLLHRSFHEKLLSVSRENCPPIASRCLDLIQRLLGSLQSIRRRELILSQGLSFMCWIVFLASPIPLLMGIGLDFKHAVMTSVAKTALTTLAFLLPSAPGALGTWHLFCLIAIYWFNPGIDQGTAIAYSIVAHLISTVSPALPGLLLLPAALTKSVSRRSRY